MSLQEQYDIEHSVGPLDTTAAPEGAIEARSYWESVWRSFKRDKVAIAGGVTIVLLIFTCFAGGPIASAILGHGPNQIFTAAVSEGGIPLKPFFTTFVNAPYPGATGHFAKVTMPLGADSAEGRDEFLRLLYGGQTSLEVAIFAT